MTFKKLLMIVGVVAAVAVIALVLFNRMRRGHGGGLLSSRSGPRLKWKFNTDGNTGTIYVADDRGTFFAVGRAGNAVWTSQVDGMLLGSAVVGADGTVYFATPNSVHALAPNGAPKWQTNTPFQGTTGLALADDGTIYGAGTDGMYAVRADGSLKWTLHTMAGTGAPTIAPDGTIYFPCGYMWVCAVEDQGSPLAKSPWPKMYHDNANSSRILTAF
jgi:hypothetical protein